MMEASPPPPILCGGTGGDKNNSFFRKTGVCREKQEPRLQTRNKQPNCNTMQTELSDAHEAEEMMTQDRDTSSTSLPPSTNEASSESSSDSGSSSGTREIRVALEIGHGGGDSGAEFVSPYDKEYEGEYDYWSQHAQAIVDQIQSEFESNKHRLPIPTEISVRTFNRGSYPPTIDKKGKSDHGLTEMVKAVAAWNPHVAVGLHLNSAKEQTAIGHLCVKKLFPQLEDNEDKEKKQEELKGIAEAAELALDINQRLTKLGHHQRDDTDGSKILWCKDINGGVIVEPAFASTPSEAAFLCYAYERITGAIASGIYDYMVDKGYAVRARA